MNATPVDAAYRERGIEFPGAKGELGDWVRALADVPLLSQPGEQWNYSVSSDVLGRLIEVWSGQDLRSFLKQRVFEPLGMVDTDFHVRAENHDRFATLYGPLGGGDLSNVGRTTKSSDGPNRPAGLEVRDTARESRFLQPATLYSGGGGLVGTMSDYARFCRMLLNNGELDGVQLLGRTTVAHMRINHLPDGRDMAAMGQPVWSETSYSGIGFGLGFAVVLDPVKAHFITSKGEHHWGGAASTFFWLDALEDFYVVFFTQLIPSSTYPLRRELRTMVYQALT
jgi:CubicO group peptidase (beta-lactamase class C family)